MLKIKTYVLRLLNFYFICKNYTDIHSQFDFVQEKLCFLLYTITLTSKLKKLIAKIQLKTEIHIKFLPGRNNWGNYPQFTLLCAYILKKIYRYDYDKENPYISQYHF